MSDLISRQAAIDATWFEPSYTDPLNVLTEVRDRLKALPSASMIDAEPVKHGHWIEQEHEDWKWSKEYRCSECGKYRFMTNPFGREWNYCPNCGAKNEVEE